MRTDIEYDGPKEATVEKDATKFAIACGWVHTKVMQSSRNGWPDHYYARKFRSVWVEFKIFGEEPSEQQYLRIEELLWAGVEVYVIDNMEDARVLFA